MLKGAFFLKFLMKFQIYMAQGLKLPLFSGVLNILGKNFRMEDSDICGSESYSFIIFLGQIWLDKENGRFSATPSISPSFEMNSPVHFLHIHVNFPFYKSLQSISRYNKRAFILGEEKRSWGDLANVWGMSFCTGKMERGDSFKKWGEMDVNRNFHTKIMSVVI